VVATIVSVALERLTLNEKEKKLKKKKR